MASDSHGSISLSVYETARLVSLAPWLAGHRQRLRFLVRRQRSDGGWGESDGYALVPTLSATEALLVCLERDGPSVDGTLVAAADAGLRALSRWLRPGISVPVPDLVAVELIVPALVAAINASLDRLGARLGAERTGWREVRLVLPDGMDDRHLTRLRAEAEFGTDLPAKLAHSLEAFGEVAPGASFARPRLGGVGCSPAATAAWLGAQAPPDGAGREPVAYLEAAQDRADGPVPVCTPVPVFERAWVLAALASAGVEVTVPAEVLAGLYAAVGELGAAAGDGLPTDADTTSTVLYVLARAGRPRSPASLCAYRVGDHFTSFPSERTVSTTTNAHVLRAMGAWLAHRPGESDRYGEAMAALSTWLCGQQEADGTWSDKWHASPYYATACCAVALAEHGTGQHTGPAARRAVDWVLATAREDGSWGRWRGTREETAYAVQVLLLAGTGQPGTRITTAAARGAAFLLRPEASEHPPLWHDKDLYTPTRVVRAEVIAALHLASADPAVSALLDRTDTAGGG
ncbi:MAG TPA: prenyltransferase/squalene oxidase repeat-containing protein [Pseudonocardiaceae bacterium]|jgi:hypothetical protein|nr:prenyltransferase/squalene oxidase repeat-containing protein [Pseudonocardiaceae bacterium]